MTHGYDHNQNKLNMKKSSSVQFVYFASMVRETGKEKRGNMSGAIRKETTIKKRRKRKGRDTSERRINRTVTMEKLYTIYFPVLNHKSEF